MKRRLGAHFHRISVRGVFALVLFVMTIPLFAQVTAVADEPLLQAEKITAIEQHSTSITIRANVASAAVFLNGSYEGVTTLTMRNLLPGRYRLRVEKSGYETRHVTITVRAGQSQAYYIELEKKSGLVQFSVQPADAAVYVDGTREYHNPARVDEGEHTIQFRLFGYADQTRRVYVPAHSVQTVQCELVPAAFSVSPLSVNKQRFNPRLPGTVGKTRFAFSVTNHGAALVQILNEAGETVYAATYADFATWEQSFVWDGKSDGGFPVPDGTYTAKIIARGEPFIVPSDTDSDALVQTVSFAVDSSIQIPQTAITASGSGIGTIPAASMFPKHSGLFAITGGADMQSAGRTFYAAPVFAGFLYAPFSWLELSTRFGVFAGAAVSGTPVQFGGALKCGTRKPLGAVQLDVAALFRVAGSTTSLFAPYGADMGTGLGGGIAFGLESASCYVGVSSEAVAGTLHGISGKNDVVWKNGIAAQGTFGRVTVGVYGAVHASFGHTKNEHDFRSGAYWFRAWEGGAETKIQLGNTPVSLNLDAHCVDYKEGKVYLLAQAGFAILF